MPLVAADAGESSIIAGAYKATWNGLDLGLVTTDGYQLRYRNTSIPITSDITGESIIDEIYTGTQPTITMTLQHWNAQGLEALIWWMGTQAGFADYSFGKTNGVGLKGWDAAKPLILQACHVSGGDTPTVSDANPTIDPYSITFFKTLLASNLDLQVVFSHQPRFVTVTLNIFPVSITTPNDPPTRVQSCNEIWFWDAVRNDDLVTVADPDAGSGGGGGGGGD